MKSTENEQPWRIRVPLRDRAARIVNACMASAAIVVATAHAGTQGIVGPTGSPAAGPELTADARGAALRALAERIAAGGVELDSRGASTLSPALPGGFWSDHLGRFLAPRSQQSSVLFEDWSGVENLGAEWHVGFDWLPSLASAREFPGGEVVAAANVTFEMRQLVAVAWLRWELAADGSQALRCVAQTILGGLVPESGERLDAVLIGEMDVAAWNPAAMEATLVVGLREGQAYTVRVPFQGRPGTAAADMGPRGRWQQRPEEDLAAEFVGAGRDPRAIEVADRLLVSLRSDELPGGGRSVAGELPMQVFERAPSGAWIALATAGETPRVGVGYAPWVGDDGGARWSSLVGAGSRELHTFELEFDGTSVRWAAPRVVDTGEVESVTRLALERTRDGLALVTRTADGGAVRLPTGD